MDTKPLPPLSQLEDLFSYCEDTGTLTRKKSTSSRSRAGQKVGSINSDGYLRVRVNAQEYMVHRLVWKLVTKEDIPEGCMVDHIDRDRCNNRIGNLRLANHEINQNNRDPTEGISYDNRTNQTLNNRWVATLRGKKLGYYGTKEEAIAARYLVLQQDTIRSQLL